MEPRKIIVAVHLITITDVAAGQEFTVRTVRTAQPIAGYVEESEKDEVVDRVQEAMSEAYQQ